MRSAKDLGRAISASFMDAAMSTLIMRHINTKNTKDMRNELLDRQSLVTVDGKMAKC